MKIELHSYRIFIRPQPDLHRLRLYWQSNQQRIIQEIGGCNMSRFETYSGSTTLTTIFAGLEAAAGALDLTSDELSAGFWSGKTLAQLADDKGIDIALVQQAVQEAVKAEPRAAIHQAVVNGTLTQDNADWLVQGLEKNYWGAGKLFSSGFSLGITARAY
jgi:hypothetical protein